MLLVCCNITSSLLIYNKLIFRKEKNNILIPPQGLRVCVRVECLVECYSTFCLVKLCNTTTSGEKMVPLFDISTGLLVLIVYVPVKRKQTCSAMFY